MSTSRIAATGPRPIADTGLRGGAGGAAVLVALLVAVVLVGMWHVTQGTSGIGMWDLLRYAAGARETVGGVPVADVLTGSRLPRLLAGIAVGIALGAAGALLQSVTRNVLASPDTLAVSAGSYFALSAVAAFGLSVPLWASGGVAFVGGLAAAALVLGV
ncbi:corrinoid ABC transporter permease domain protein, partial [Leifsonia aquatica ATCC 14665]